MAKTLDTSIDKKEADDKQVSLSVTQHGPDGHDIHVEVTRNLSVKKRRGQRRFAAFLFAVMFLMLFPMLRDLYAYFQMSQSYREMQQNNQDLRVQQLLLEAEKESLDSPAMIERLAREALDMVLPGESKVYQAIPTDDIPRRESLRSGDVLH